MKKIIFAALLAVSSIAFAGINSKKLGELPRSSDLEKEVAPLIPKSPRDWMDLKDSLIGPNKTFTAQSKKYSIESGGEESESGDLTRYKFTLSKTGQKTKLGDGPLAWVYVSNDEQYIFHEPLVAISTKNWVSKNIAEPLIGSGYFQLLKYSSSAEKVIVAQFACAMDCPKTDKFNIWEISLVANGQSKKTAKAKCLKAGGRWGTWSKFEASNNIEQCRYKSKDAGKSCHDGKECSVGLCEYDPKNKTAQCPAYEGSQGCHIWMDKGLPQPELCKD